jgi:hypothetical protein
MFGQYSRQYLGSSLTILSRSISWSGSRPTVALVPSGQLRSRCKLGSRTISAVIRSQSSQYHHLFVAPAQGGNGTHESQVQFGHGFVAPSPSSKMIVATKTQITLTMRPKNRTIICFVFDKQLCSIPKKSRERRSIVDKPHRNPYAIPPKSICRNRGRRRQSNFRKRLFALHFFS